MIKDADTLFRELARYLEARRLEATYECVNLFKQFKYDTLSELKTDQEDWLLVHLADNCAIVKRSNYFSSGRYSGLVLVQDMAAALLLTGADVRYSKKFLGPRLFYGLCQDIPWDCE